MDLKPALDHSPPYDPNDDTDETVNNEAPRLNSDGKPKQSRSSVAWSVAPTWAV